MNNDDMPREKQEAGQKCGHAGGREDQ